jgi:phosphoglycolate phosphatase
VPVRRIDRFTVGFDLDMTLADTREGIAAVYDALAAETGVRIDSSLIATRLGPPLEVELANWFPAEHVPAMIVRFRELYADIAIPATVVMAGALAALAAVRDAGGRSMVVTAKNQLHAEGTVRFLGLPVDRIAGGLWASAKGAALVEQGARVYVGDHFGDVDAARAAGALSVAVATGPYDASALSAYGADVVLPDLRAFPGWLTGHLAVT